MKLFLLALTLSSTVFSYELIKVQAVSSSQTTFVTRQGKKDGIIVGQKATFTSENMSFIAKAKNVSREYTQWESDSKNLRIPFQVGETLTYNQSEDHIWTLTPYETRKKYLKRYNYQEKRALLLRTSIAKALSSSVSGASADSEKSRGGFFFEGLYEFSLNERFLMAAGLRYEKETSNFDTTEFETYRSMLVAEITYIFKPLLKMDETRPFVSLGIGYGYSQTSATGYSGTGTAMLLPAVKIGMSTPLSDQFEFVTDLGMESLATLESADGTDDVRTTQLNGKVTFGIRKYY